MVKTDLELEGYLGPKIPNWIIKKELKTA